MVEGLTTTAPYQGFGACGREYIAHSTRLKICGERPRRLRVRSLLPKRTRDASSERDRSCEFVPRPDAYDPGDSSGEATPVPIPNTEVKLSSAEDTERAAFRENRPSPGFLRFRGRSARTARSLTTLAVARQPARAAIHSMTWRNPRPTSHATHALRRSSARSSSPPQAPGGAQSRLAITAAPG